MKGVFVTDKTSVEFYVFINTMIFAFVTFVTNTPLQGKTVLKSEKNSLQIANHIFWMLQAAKYPIYDFTFTFSYFFI